MPKTVADYEDAVRRIANANVPEDATTEAEVRDALRGAAAPQVTREVADGIASSLLTEDRVLDAIEASGEIPSASEIDAIVSVADDYDMNDRVAAVSQEISGSVVTVEDVESAVRERQEKKGDRPTFRGEVETAVDEAGRGKEFVGQTADEVTAEQAREIGAPRESEFRKAATQTIAGAEQVNPSEVVEGTTASTPVQVIRDEGGDVVAATGGPREEIGEQVAAEFDAEYLDTSEVEENLGVRGSGRSVDLTLRGQKVGEVDVE